MPIAIELTANTRSNVRGGGDDIASAADTPAKHPTASTPSAADETTANSLRAWLTRFALSTLAYCLIKVAHCVALVAASFWMMLFSLPSSKNHCHPS